MDKGLRGTLGYGKVLRFGIWNPHMTFVKMLKHLDRFDKNDLVIDKIADWRQHYFMIYGWLLKGGSRGRGSYLIKDKYSLTYNHPLLFMLIDLISMITISNHFFLHVYLRTGYI